MKLRKLLSIILSALLIISVTSVIPATASAAESKTVKTSGGDITDENFEYDYGGGTAQIKKYIGSDTKVIIPETLNYGDSYTINGIRANAFENNDTIKEVVIPASVKTIEGSAFYNCTALESVKILGAVTIADSAFNSCTSLKEVSLPDTLETIGDNAFRACAALETLELPEGITVIGDKTFRECAALKTINLPTTLNSLGYNVFQDCAKLEKIEIPANIKGVKSYCFYGCSALSEVTFPVGFTTIESYAFGECSNLATVNQRDSQLNWSNNAIIGEGNEPIYSANMVFDYVEILPEYEYTLIDGKIEITKYNGTDADVVIPSFYDGYTVSSIDSEAFKDKDEIMSIDVPETVTSIFGYTFSGLKKLKLVVLHENLKEILAFAFAENESLENINLPSTLDTIGKSAFMDCVKLNRITLPENIKNLGRDTFAGCENLFEVNLNSGLETVGENAFLGCDLNEIEIPETVSTIKDHAFGFTFDGNDYQKVPGFVIKGYKGSAAEQYAKDNGFDFEDITPIPYSYIFVDDDIEIIDYYGTNKEDVVIPDEIDGHKVLYISQNAFKDHSEIKTITFPAGIKKITSGAFINCTSITEFKLDSSNDDFTVEDGAVYSKDKTILWVYPAGSEKNDFTVPASVNEIASYAFNSSVSLEKIIIPENVLYIQEGAFMNCKKLDTVEFNEGLNFIQRKAFFGCDSLKKVTVPKSLRDIDNFALGYYDYESIETKYPDFVIRGYDGYVGDAYAQVWGISFEEIEEETTSPEPETTTEPETAATEPEATTEPETAVTEPEATTEPETAVTEPEATTKPATAVTEPEATTQPATTVTEPESGTQPATTKPDSAKTETKPKPVSSKTNITKWKVTGIKNKSYTGKAITQKVLVSKDGEYASVKLNYKNNLKVGKATIIIKGTGDYTGTIKRTFRITKAKQPMTAKTAVKKINASKLKKSKQKIKNAIVVKKNKGAVSYQKVNKGSSAKLSITKKGVIIVKKGKYKKGKVLKLKVKITAKGNSSYKSGSKTLTVRIKIK